MVESDHRQNAQQPETNREIGWSRAGQDAAEAEFPPPEEPQDEPKVRSMSMSRFALILFVTIGWFVLALLLRWLGGGGGGF
jgi:hypothetical protein